MVSFVIVITHHHLFGHFHGGGPSVRFTLLLE